MLVANSVSAFEISQRGTTEGQSLTDALSRNLYHLNLQATLDEEMVLS